MIDIVDRLRFDAVRCEATFSKGVASNIEAGAKEIERLRQALADIVNPIDALRRYAKENDRELDGHLAVQLAKSPDHLKKIARDALNQQLEGNE